MPTGRVFTTYARERLLGRIRAGIESGELPAKLDADRLASFMMTVLYGLSIQARDGATLDELESTIDLAMIARDDAVAAALHR